MGYDLHVTRSEDWSRPVGGEITPAEWSQLVEADPQLRRDEQSGPHAVVWTDDAGSLRGWFDWYQGSIFTTNPDQATVSKLLEFASHFGARVQGDGGELYQNATEWTPR